MSEGLLFVDDERENVALAAEILGEALGTEVVVADSVEKAVELLQARPWRAIIMDLFIPLGDHPNRVLGPRTRGYQENIEHLGGLVLLEEIDRLPNPPIVISHTACTDPVLHELFEDRVVRMIPKPAPLEALLSILMEELARVIEGIDWVGASEVAPALAVQIALGLCLAATTGLRTFLPLLAVNLMAMAGAMELNESFAFVGHWGATVIFGTATLIEILGDKVIGVDHTLDAIGVFAKPVAATVLAAAVLVELDPLAATVLGLVGGGASASALGLVKAQVRTVASVTTAGIGNAALSLIEDAVAIVAVIVSVLLPGLALLLFAVALWFVLRWVRRARATSETA